MFIRGIDGSQEYKRDDQSFYKGIVVKNNDPRSLHRVKVYIPEISNAPIVDWLLKYKSVSVKFPGTNNKFDGWRDVKTFEKIVSLIPWAEPCFPLMGESGPGRYNSIKGEASVSDSNHSDGEKNVTPSFYYEKEDTCLGDKFIDPFNSRSDFVDRFTNNINPYSYEGRPSNHVNKSTGSFSVPRVGSKVWVFHYNGDINFPVYFGVRQDFRDTSLINNLDQPGLTETETSIQSLNYPAFFENYVEQDIDATSGLTEGQAMA